MKIKMKNYMIMCQKNFGNDFRNWTFPLKHKIGQITYIPSDTKGNFTQQVN